RYLLLLSVAAMLAGPTIAWACRAAGPDTHVGTLLSVDAEKKSFTIMDAEARSPITFVADDAIISALKGVTGTVAVLHKKVDGVLRAIDIRY
ncbi:MAG: hypothetical protein ACE5K1_06595, partial [Acidiferrobacterales bacterium]